MLQMIKINQQRLKEPISIEKILGPTVFDVTTY